MFACMARYVFCMCILICYKRWLVLGIKQMGTTANKETYDEQKALRQALFLVDLLKSEYSKVLRENNEMKSRVLWEEGSMTCATASMNIHASSLIDEKGDIERAPATPQVHHWPRRNQPIFSPVRHWRRRYPQVDPNVYYDISARRNDYNDDYVDKENAAGWRRFHYEDAFGPPPGGGGSVSRSTKSASSASTYASTPSPAAPSSIPSTENDNILTVANSSSVVLTPKSTKLTKIKASVTTDIKKETVTTPLATSGRTTRRIMLLLSKKTSTTSINVSNSKDKLQSSTPTKFDNQKLSESSNATPRATNLELSQAAAELEKELDANFVNWKSNRISRKLPILWRASTRVHLAGSTRYQIPLPENHAFCYTNPHNALCRTFI